MAGLGLRLGLGLQPRPAIQRRPLEISGTPVTTATEDEAYTGFTVSASGGTPPYSYSLVGAWPAGISVNSSTGEVSGTPTEAGTFASLSVRVTDANTATDDLLAFTLEVEELIGTYALVYKTSNQSVGAADTPLTWDAEIADLEGVYNVSSNTSHMTVPASWDGRYGRVSGNAVSDASSFTLSTLRDGASYLGRAFGRTTTSGNNSLNVMGAVLPLTAGQYYELQVANFSSNNVLSGEATWFSIEEARVTG